MTQILIPGQKRDDAFGGKLAYEQARNRLIGRDQNGLARLLISATGNNFSMKISQDDLDVLTAQGDQLVFNSDNNLFKIVDSGDIVVPSVTTVLEGTNTYSGFNTAQAAHGLGFRPLVVAFYEISPSQYVLMPFSETVGANVPQGGIQSRVLRVTTSTTNVELFVYKMTYSPGIGAGSYPDGRNVRYFLLRETVS